MKKIFLILTIFLLSGCAKNDLKNYSKNMNLKEIESYVLDLRVNGDYNNNRVRENYRINNYKNEQILFKYTAFSFINGENKREDKEYLKQNNTVYILKDRTYEKTNDKIKYENIQNILEGLKEVKKIKDEKTEKIGQKDYKLYEVIMKDKFINKLFEDYGYKGNYKKVAGKIYIDKQTNKVYRIIYYVDNLELSASYSSFGKIKKIEIN